MKVSLSNQVSNTNVKAAANGLIEAGLLAEYHVTFAVFPESLLDRLAGMGIFSEIRRRRFDPALKPFIKSWPWFELGRQISLKAGFSKLVKNENSIFNHNSVNLFQDKRVAAKLKVAAQRGVDTVYCFEDLAVFTFREAKSLGLKCLYELPIGHWRTMHQLLEGERQKWPEWAATLTNFSDSQAKLERKDEELRLADHIFVASTFTANTLKDFPGNLAPIQVIPYGFSPVCNHKRTYGNIKKRLKILFVGGLSQRKGIAYLFEAAEILKNYVELTVVGQRTGECKALDVELAKHSWIPTIAHKEVLKIMKEHDVLVFPSLFEGFGLVITEAMSQGTPVITTDRTAGPDLIITGQNGWIIEAGSTEALIEAIEGLLNQPKSIAEAGREAMETARKRPWEVYGSELAAAIKSLA